MPPTKLEDLLQPADTPQNLEALLAEHRQATANVNAGLTPGGLTQAQQAEGREFFKETLPRASVAGGVGLALTPLTGGMSLPVAMGTEAGIIGAADVGYQALRKAIDPSRQINPRESFDIGATSAVGTGVSRTAFDILSRLAGVAPQFTRYFRNARNTGKYNRTMIEPEKRAEFDLGERIKAAVDEWRSSKTSPRVFKEDILQQADAADIKISADPIIHALEKVKLSAPKTPVGDKLNAELGKIQAKFMSISKAPADLPGGQLSGRVSRSPRKDLSPLEVDEFLTREIDRRIYDMSGSPKNQALAESLANARGEIREALLSALPDEARVATKQIYDELTKREAATKAIQPGLVTLETKVRNIFKPGHQGELDALQHVSEQTGIDFSGEAFKLAQKRAYTPDERLATKGLDAVMEIIRGAFARPLLKATAPLQALGPPAAGAVRAGTFEERKRRGR